MLTVHYSKRYFFAILVLCLTSGINFVPLTVFWTVQVYTVYQASFYQAGIWLLPIGFCIIGGAGMSAFLISVFKRYIMWVMLFFCIMQTVGLACVALFDPDNINSIWAPMIFGLFGVGGVLLPSQVIFSLVSPDDLIGTSIALSVVIRMLGQVVGKTLFLNILQTNIINKAVDIIGVPAVLAGFKSVDRIVQFVAQLSGGPIQYYIDRGMYPEIIPANLPALLKAGAELYAQSLPLVYLLSIPWGALACISCLALYGIERYIDDHVAVHLA